MRGCIFKRRHLPAFLIGTIAICLSFSQCYVGTEYWVRPNINVSCPVDTGAQNCITLSDIIASTKARNYLITSNTIVRFLPGVHTSNQSGWVLAKKNAANITIVGTEPCRFTGNEQHCNTTIQCDHNTSIGFAFIKSKNVRLKDLHISMCGNNVKHNVQRSNLLPLTSQEDVNVTLLTEYTLNGLKIEHVYIESRRGVGFVVVNPLGKSVISGVLVKSININEELGRNVLLFKDLSSNNQVLKNSAEITIQKSSFLSVDSQESLFCEMIRSSGNTDRNRGLAIKFATFKNKITTNINSCYFYSNHSCFGGGIAAIFTGKHGSKRTLKINNSTIEGGSSHEGGGLYIGFHNSQNFIRDQIAINVLVNNTDFLNNRGGGMMFKLDKTRSVYEKEGGIRIKIKIYYCNFMNNSALSTSGGALYIGVTINASRFPDRVDIAVSKCDLHRNLAEANGGGIYIQSKTPEAYSMANKITMLLKENIILGNSGRMGSALYLDGGNSHIFSVIITTTLFSRNKVFNLYSDDTRGVLHLKRITELVICNSNITDNEGNGVFLDSSVATLNGYVKIKGNNGSGIFIDCSSASLTILMLSKDGSVLIVNNTAQKYGGGIRVSDNCDQQKPCFFQLTDQQRGLDRPLVKMQQNTAGIAGSSIYGGNFEQCQLDGGKSGVSFETLKSIFDIDDINSSSSAVASPGVYKVCICTQEFSFGRSCPTERSLEVYPGKVFHVPVAAVGQYNYASRMNNVIGASFKGTAASLVNINIEEQQFKQIVDLQCKNLQYSLITTEVSEVENRIEIDLIVSFPRCSKFNTTCNPQTAVINILLLECPYGFELDKECVCVAHLREVQGITCNIDNQTIHRPESMWIGNFSNDILYHNNCPFDYCINEALDLDPNDQQEQCAFNRSGVLCGACRQGLSLLLGSSQCKTCSNTYLLLVVPFGIAGILLIFLMLKFNLTVSTGTINGLIFYANVIQVNQHIFFPQGKIYGLQFIAWLNLDLGFEVCFFNGLNAYIRTWLQFVFPIYIWLIVGLLILVSRYSTRVSMLTGSNTVSVLATLFLLSYTKLLRTTFHIFYSTPLTDRNGSVTHLWQMDGNYLYLGWYHTLIFIAGIFLLLTHILPFTFLLLIAPFLQKMTNYRILCWIVKLKPLLDAYQGPYKDKYRSWVGLMLLVRMFLFSVFAANVQGKPRISLLVTILTMLMLLIIMIKTNGVYKAKLPNFLELYFLVNLKIYSIVLMYLLVDQNSLKRDQITLCYFMIGSAFGAFLCTFGYHCYKKLTEYGINFKTVAEKLKGPPKDTETPRQEPEITARPPVSVSYIELREPLLND